MRTITFARASAVAAWLLVLAVSDAMAGPIIDFEEPFPTGITGDDSSVFDEYRSAFGVTFQYFAGTASAPIETKPFVEKRGTEDPQGTDAFVFDGRGPGDPIHDTGATPGATARLGDFLLRGSAPGFDASGFGLLRIVYDTGVAGAGGDIWDIDAAPGQGPDGSLGTEQWRITAFDALDGVVDSVLTPLGVAHTVAGSLDALPFLWGVNSKGRGNIIRRIDIAFVGSKVRGVGLGFDNFSVDIDPRVAEPMALGLLGLGMVTIGAAGTRARHGGRQARMQRCA